MSDPATPGRSPPASADERFVLVLVPFGESAVPVGRRVAQVLKYAKRAMGMRCVEVSSYTPTEQLERLTDELIALRRLLERANRKPHPRLVRDDRS